MWDLLRDLNEQHQPRHPPQNLLCPFGAWISHSWTAGEGWEHAVTSSPKSSQAVEENNLEAFRYEERKGHP